MPKIASILVWGLASGAALGQPHDPDWPCIQRRVPALTIAQMWAGPQPAPDWQDRPELRELARGLAARRVSVEEATAVAGDYVAGLDAAERGRALASLFAAVLDRINAERSEIIAGIGRYARRQTAEAERVEAMQADLAALEAAPEGERDVARIEELRTALAWETRIFRDRAQSLTYVCETPVLLERRAFELARAFGGLI
jgi:hypothetical protein